MIDNQGIYTHKSDFLPTTLTSDNKFLKLYFSGFTKQIQNSKIFHVSDDGHFITSSPNDHFIPTHGRTLLYLYRHSFVSNEMECMNLPKIGGQQPDQSMSIYHPVYNHLCVDDTYPTECML